MSAFEDAFLAAALSGRLHALTLFNREGAWTASARWNGAVGWTEAKHADPVEAGLLALTAKPNRDQYGQIPVEQRRVAPKPLNKHEPKEPEDDPFGGLV